MELQECLQKVNDICETRNFNLMEKNREKYAEKALDLFNAEDADAESITKQMERELETAYHFSNGAVAKATKDFAAKENDYKTKISELQKKTSTKDENESSKTFDIPQELKDELEAAKKYRQKEELKGKSKEISALVLKGMNDEQKAFAKDFIETQSISLDDDVAEKSKALIKSITKLWTARTGNTNPLDSISKTEDYKDILEGLKKKTI